MDVFKYTQIGPWGPNASWGRDGVTFAHRAPSVSYPAISQNIPQSAPLHFAPRHTQPATVTPNRIHTVSQVLPRSDSTFRLVFRFL